MNVKKIRIFISETYDPWFNLATEDWIFNDMCPETHVLFLWRNQDTVVIGRFQNPWTECHTEKMDRDGIKLARRQSGGGAVFQDLGNTNFTFFSGQEGFCRERNNRIITKAIGRFGIKAYTSGRNDILVDADGGPRKISGSAFKEKKDRAFHHGTLLINADLNKLADYLNPSKKKLTSKGILSVRSRVTNLKDLNNEISHELLSTSIIEEFWEKHDEKCEVEILNHDWLKRNDSLSCYFEKLKDWNWRFGETPKFDHHLSKRFDWGEFDVHLNSHKGLVTAVKIYTDSLHPELVEELEKSFIGHSYSKEGVMAAIGELVLKLPFYQDELEEFQCWLVKEVS